MHRQWSCKSRCLNLHFAVRNRNLVQYPPLGVFEAKHTRRSSNFSICRLQITMLQLHCSYELKRRIYSAGTCKDLFTSSELKQSIKTNICEVIKSHKRIDDEQNKWNASNIKPLSIFMTSELPAMSDI